MATRRTPRRSPSGRRTRLLEPGTHERLVSAVRRGAPVSMAASFAGIADRTFTDWMMRGRIEEERICTADGDGQMPAPDANEAIFLRLYREVLEARAEAGVRGVLNVERAAAGGAIISETIETDPDGTTRKTIVRARPEWKAAAFLLERQHRAAFGKDAVQVEVTGVPIPTGDGAVSIGGVDIADMTARLVANLAAARDDVLALPAAEDVQDAEVVE